VAELTQPWFNVPVSRKFMALAAQCKDQGRQIFGWNEFICSEAVWPYYIPSPMTMLSNLRELDALQVDGILDFWGIPRTSLDGTKPDANLTVFSIYRRDPSRTDDAILLEAAERLYGARAGEEAVAAWKYTAQALAKWAIVSWSQRMHWPLRRMFDAYQPPFIFYLSDLTLDPVSDAAPKMWPPMMRDPEMWRSLSENLKQVIALYDQALGHYDRVCALSGSEEALFHHDSLWLGRTYQQMAYETCLYHVAHFTGQPLPRELMGEGAQTRRLCMELTNKLNTVPMERALYSAAARMTAASFDG
jgi:hypothetical protein